MSWKLAKVNELLTELNLFPVSFPGQGGWEGVQRGGDPLRRAGDPHLQERLPPGAQGVHLGPQFVRLPPLRGGEAVHIDGAPSHQLRAHAQPDPAGGGQLRGALQTQRGRAAAAARKALRESRTQTRRTIVKVVLTLWITSNRVILWTFIITWSGCFQVTPQEESRCSFFVLPSWKKLERRRTSPACRFTESTLGGCSNPPLNIPKRRTWMQFSVFSGGKITSALVY